METVAEPSNEIISEAIMNARPHPEGEASTTARKEQDVRDGRSHDTIARIGRARFVAGEVAEFYESEWTRKSRP